jgi:hypothetical protein
MVDIFIDVTLIYVKKKNFADPRSHMSAQGRKTGIMVRPSSLY